MWSWSRYRFAVLGPCFAINEATTARLMECTRPCLGSRRAPRVGGATGSPPDEYAIACRLNTASTRSSWGSPLATYVEGGGGHRRARGPPGACTPLCVLRLAVLRLGSREPLPGEVEPDGRVQPRPIVRAPALFRLDSLQFRRRAAQSRASARNVVATVSRCVSNAVLSPITRLSRAARPTLAA